MEIQLSERLWEDPLEGVQLQKYVNEEEPE
jgi:hypothetical protein